MVEEAEPADRVPMVPVNVRVPPPMKAAGVALAKKRGTNISGLLKLLLRDALVEDRAASLASVASEQPQLGASINVTTRVLTGDCLHPIHMRTQLPHHDRCEGCGAKLRRPS